MRKSQLIKMLEQIAGDPEIILELDRVSAIYISEDFNVFGREISPPVANDLSKGMACTDPKHNHKDDRGFCLG